MKWMKENTGWIASLVGIVILLFGWLSGTFGEMVETKAAPVAHSVAQEEIRIHNLTVEPRMQAVETLASGNKQKLTDIEQKLDDSLEIQRQILREVQR